MKINNIPRVKEIEKELEDLTYALETICLTSEQTRSVLRIDRKYSINIFRDFSLGSHEVEIKIPKSIKIFLEEELKKLKEELLTELEEL